MLVVCTTTARRSPSGSSATKPEYNSTQNFQDDWFSTQTDMKNFPPWCFLSVSRATKNWLLPGDHAGRLRFSEKLQPRVKILPDILLTDEAPCTQDGIKNLMKLIISTANSQYWAQKHYTQYCMQRRFSVNVYYGVLGSNLNVPHVMRHYTL